MDASNGPQLADLVERESKARATGTVVVGARQAYMTLLFGEAVHAIVPDLGLRGLAAVERMGNLAAGGASIHFTPDEPPGTGRSLREVPMAKVLERLRMGEGTPLAPAPDHASRPHRATSDPPRAETITSSPEGQTVTTGYTAEPRPSTTDEVAPSVLETSPPPPPAPLAAPADGGQVAGEGGGLPPLKPSAPWLPQRVPPHLPGDALVAGMDVRKAKIANLVSGLGLAQVCLDAPGARGIAIIDFGNVQDAVYEDPSGRLEGRAAYQAMQRAPTGTITITTVEGSAAAVLPVVWRGEEQLVDAPSSTTGLARMTESLTARRADAAILLRVAGATGLRLISAGQILAEVPDRAGFEALVHQDEARISVYFTEAVEELVSGQDMVATGTAEKVVAISAPDSTMRDGAVQEPAPLPDPPQPTTALSADEDWDQLLRQLAVYARSRLHRHSAHVEEIIENTEHSLPAILATARQLRDLRPRVGNSRDVMEDIANQVDLVARQRVSARNDAAPEGSPEV